MDANSTIRTPTAQHTRQQFMNFHGSLPKSHQNGEKLTKKEVKKNKNSPFFVQ
jgi:hypothetical protein